MVTQRDRLAEVSVAREPGHPSRPPLGLLEGSPVPMVNCVKDYDWGSTTALAGLLGREPSGGPEAELWVGAHPSGPSELVGDDGVAHRLDEIVEQAPEEVLGRRVHERFGDRLPFLLKILAIEHPLSLQVHPDAARAAECYRDPTLVAGGEHRYIDPWHKPELVYALEPTDALCGFRTSAAAARLLTVLDVRALDRLLASLLQHRDDRHCVEEAFEHLVRWPAEESRGLVDDVGRACGRLLADGDLGEQDRRAVDWAQRLTRAYPEDPLVAAPFLLELVRLEPGDTMFVPAAAPHGYLHGLAVEIMASSDNVLRAGLTHKTIAVEELLHVVDGDSRPVLDVPVAILGEHEIAWRPRVAEFQLTRTRLDDGETTVLDPRIDGPQLLLCTDGRARVTCGTNSRVLAPGRSAFVAAGAEPVAVEGPCELFRAAAGEPG